MVIIIEVIIIIIIFSIKSVPQYHRHPAERVGNPYTSVLACRGWFWSFQSQVFLELSAMLAKVGAYTHPICNPVSWKFKGVGPTALVMASTLNISIYT